MTEGAPYDDAALAVLRRRAKAALRKRMQGLRQALPGDAVAKRSEAICARLLAMPAWQRARCVSLFVATRDEVHLDALIDDARARGATVAVPAVREGERAMRLGALLREGREFPLRRSDFGVMEPGDDAPLVAPDLVDLVVIPALAVDPAGQRLGYGRAHYDATLPLMTRALRVVVAFDFQLIAEVPAEAHDVPAQVVLTDARHIVVDPAIASEVS